jgi:hypothetical protein
MRSILQAKKIMIKSQKDTILNIYKDLAVPVLLYGSECWILTKQQLQQIESSEMRFLRSVGGYSTDKTKKKNTNIRRHLKVFNLREKLNKGMPTELLRMYFKYENLLNSSQDIRLPP